MIWPSNHLVHVNTLSFWVLWQKISIAMKKNKNDEPKNIDISRRIGYFKLLRKIYQIIKISNLIFLLLKKTLRKRFIQTDNQTNYSRTVSFVLKMRIKRMKNTENIIYYVSSKMLKVLRLNWNVVPELEKVSN